MEWNVNMTYQCWSDTASQLHILGGKLGFRNDATGQRNNFGRNSNKQPIPKSC